MLRGVNDLTSPMRRDPICDISHLVVISSFALPLSGSVSRDG